MVAEILSVVIFGWELLLRGSNAYQLEEHSMSGGRAGAKALRLECTWSVGGRRRSPGKLEKSGEGRAGGMGPES